MVESGKPIPDLTGGVHSDLSPIVSCFCVSPFFISVLRIFSEIINLSYTREKETLRFNKLGMDGWIDGRMGRYGW